MESIKIAKILIANRGEIAGRIISTAKKMGICTVAVYAHDDKDAPYVEKADEAYLLEGNMLSETYLNQKQIIEIALKAGVQGIHPGYGFLAENHLFAQECIDNGFIWIGPSPEVIELMANKLRGKGAAERSGVPTLKTLIGSSKEITLKKDELIFPVIVKPTEGGGGKGMFIAYTPEEFEETLQKASRQAKAYFDSEELYVEQYIARARHIEVQILGDNYGNIIHLYDRECTIQRRYQKIIEEAPSFSLTSEQRKTLLSYALKLAKAINYINAGTIEFLLDEKGNFYFLEVNTRIQVEHPVTELITNIDIVEEQLKIASGHPLSYRQSDVQISGHAIEARIYAEDPANRFMPFPGELILHNMPNDARVDADLKMYNKISSAYDPMIAKLSVSGEDRDECIKKIELALMQFVLEGATNNVSFLLNLLRSEEFVKNKIHIKYLDEKLNKILVEEQLEKENTQNIYPLIAAYSIIQLNQTISNPVNVWHKIGKWKNNYHDVNIASKNVMINCKKKNDFLIQLEFNGMQADVGDYKLIENKTAFYIDNKPYTVYYYINRLGFITLILNGLHYSVQPSYIERLKMHKQNLIFKEKANKEIVSPLTGRLIKLQAEKGRNIKKGDVLAIIESMKMENNVIAATDGNIREVYVFQGEQVSQNQLLLEVS